MGADRITILGKHKLVMTNKKDTKEGTASHGNETRRSLSGWHVFNWVGDATWEISLHPVDGFWVVEGEGNQSRDEG
ncbi:MAG: hypothetical protein JKX97_05415 [Candidatus Lindowbacteria bacterium]|nr:hypothetical protein [Candidatus Lindowbacteria bacterium]